MYLDVTFGAYYLGLSSGSGPSEDFTLSYGLVCRKSNHSVTNYTPYILDPKPRTRRGVAAQNAKKGHAVVTVLLNAPYAQPCIILTPIKP